MDFFEAQDRAQARTKLLVFYFALAVILIITAVYFAVTAGVYFFHAKVNSPVAPELLSGLRLAWTAGIIVPLITFGSLWRITQLRRTGGAGVAEAMGGRKINPSTKRPQERKLMNVVEEMAIASGTPVPEVFLLDGELGINAFAAGFSLDDAAVGITQGAIDQLDRDELQGVIAHEFSHILNGDMGLSTKLSGWIFGIVMLTVLGRGFWALIRGDSSSGRRSGGGIYVGGGRGRSSGGGNSKGNGGGALILAIILVAVLITIIGFIGEFFARLIQAAVSRQREYLADAAAVQFTRNPEGIGNALRRIGGSASCVTHPQASEFAHAFFSKSLRSEVSFLATHPPLQKRISRVLKDWQGDYLKPRPRPKPEQAESEKTKPGKPAFGPAIGPDGEVGGGQFQQMLTAGLFMKCLGEMREQGRAYAEETRKKLQEALPEIFEQVDQSPLAILALLYQIDEAVAPKQMLRIAEALPGQQEAVPLLADSLRSLSRSERLILLEMMAARLPEALIEPEREDFIACIEDLAQADNKVSPFEIAGLHIVRRHLRKEAAQAPARQDMKAIIAAASTLATRLAAETQLEGASSAAILQSASRQAPYFMNQLVPAQTTDFAALEEAFAVMARTSFGIRKQFLAICERIVAADEKASEDEVELLRAIAMGIGVPAAPIFSPSTGEQ
ncbi:MAG: M48 family metallopeptidase [Opitutales bacterium]